MISSTEGDCFCESCVEEDKVFIAQASEVVTVSPGIVHQWKTCSSIKMAILFSPSTNQGEYFRSLEQLSKQEKSWSEALSQQFDNIPVKKIK